MRAKFVWQDTSFLMSYPVQPSWHGAAEMGMGVCKGRSAENCGCSCEKLYSSVNATHPLHPVSIFSGDDLPQLVPPEV